MNRVIIKIKATQEDIDGNLNEIEMMSEGTHYSRDNNHYVLYEDDVSASDGAVSTILKISSDSLSLVRKGVIYQEQNFQLDKESTSIYRTPYGNLNLSICTNLLDIEYADISGNIHVQYSVAINGQMQSKNDLNIDIYALANEQELLH